MGQIGSQITRNTRFFWHKTEVGVKGSHICHLLIVITHKNGFTIDAENDNDDVAVPEEILYHKDILGKWVKENCLTAPISFNQGV